MKDLITLKTPKEIKIISNPIRMKVLKNYYALNTPTTVKQMAVHMGEVPANIHYHVKKLIEINVLELDHTQSVNGIIAKFYVPSAKSIVISDDDETSTCVNEKEIIINNVFEQGKTQFVAAMDLKSDEVGKLVNTEVMLTEEEHKKVLDYIEQLVDKKEKQEGVNQKKYMFFSAIAELDT